MVKETVLGSRKEWLANRFIMAGLVGFLLLLGFAIFSSGETTGGEIGIYSGMQGDGIDAYSNLLDYVVEVKAMPKSNDRTDFINLARDSIKDNEVTRLEYLKLLPIYQDLKRNDLKNKIKLELE